MSNRTGIIAEDKELAKLEVEARSQGWDVQRSGGGHMKWFAPDGETIIVTSMTPGSRSSLRRVRGDLMKAGLKLNERVSRRVKHQAHSHSRPTHLAAEAVLWEAIDDVVESAEREVAITRAKFIMSMGDATDDELAVAYRMLPERQQQALLRIVVSGDNPSRDCVCGRTFLAYIAAEVHRERCNVAMGIVPPEPAPTTLEPPAPTTPPEPFEGLETPLKGVSQRADTIPDVIPTPVTPEPDNNTTEEQEMNITTTTCRTCNKEFDSPQARAGHERSHRSGHCEHCNAEFPENALGSHSSKCSKNPDRLKNLRRRKVSCPHCFKEMQQSSLYTHVRAHCPVAEHARRMGPSANNDSSNGAAVDTTTVEGEDEFFDALLAIITEGKPLAFSLSTMKVVNAWMEATRQVLALLPEEES